MRKYLTRSWINPKLAGGPSKIHGAGVLATAPLAVGEKLMEFGGEKISAAEANGDDYRARSVWIVADDTYLGLRIDDPHPSLDENLNHSCDPNAWLTDEVTMVARRNIAAGEEITLDQGTWNFDEDEYTWDRDHCGCGSCDCRKTLTQNDWMLDTLQQRYKGHFHPIVQQLIEKQKRQK